VAKGHRMCRLPHRRRVIGSPDDGKSGRTCPVRFGSKADIRTATVVRFEPKDFGDAELEATFEQIRSRITRLQHGQMDPIAATCRQMPDQEAAEVADFIFSLFLRIAEQCERPCRTLRSRKLRLHLPPSGKWVRDISLLGSVFRCASGLTRPAEN
jgi:hypothetical protein